MAHSCCLLAVESPSPLRQPASGRDVVSQPYFAGIRGSLCSTCEPQHEENIICRHEHPSGPLPCLQVVNVEGLSGKAKASARVSGHLPTDRLGCPLGQKIPIRTRTVGDAAAHAAEVSREMTTWRAPRAARVLDPRTVHRRRARNQPWSVRIRGESDCRVAEAPQL